MTDSTGSLRAELGGSAPRIPRFRLVAPPGWIMRRFDNDDFETEFDRVITELVRQGRPELVGQLRAIGRHSVTQLRSNGGLFWLAPGPDTPQEARVPTAVVGALQRSRGGVTLDQLVQLAITKYNGVPIGRDKRMVRWIRSGKTPMGAEQLRTQTVNYLIPIPGTMRSQAVQMTASILDVEGDEPVREAWVALLDTYLSSFSWEP